MTVAKASLFPSSLLTGTATVITALWAWIFAQKYDMLFVKFSLLASHKYILFQWKGQSSIQVIDLSDNSDIWVGIMDNFTKEQSSLYILISLQILPVSAGSVGWLIAEKNGEIQYTIGQFHNYKISCQEMHYALVLFDDFIS